MQPHAAMIQVPRFDRVIVRDALERLVDQVDGARMVLVQAPAGYGKTHTLARWAALLGARDRPVLWLSCRGGVTDAAGLARVLGIAGAAAGFDLPPGDADTFVDRLLAVARPSDARPAIIIDDAHLLDAAAQRAIAPMIEHGRDALTVLLGTRETPDLPLGRLRARGRMVEVGPPLLAFSASEVVALTALYPGVSANPSSTSAGDPTAAPAPNLGSLLYATSTLAPQLAEPAAPYLGGLTGTVLPSAPELVAPGASHLRGPTDAALTRALDGALGWAAGLSIMLRAAEGGGGSVTATRHLRQYLAEEIVGAMDGTTRDFLCDSAVLRVMTHDACVAVSGNADAGALLGRAERKGWFVSPASDAAAAWTLHPMLRDLLLAEVDVDHLHRRAALHFVASGAVTLGLDHAARTHDPAFLGAMIEEAAEPLVYTGLLPVVVGHAEQLPWSTLATLPRTLLALAWSKARRLSFGSAERLICAAEQFVAGVDLDPYDPQLADLRRTIRHRRLMLSAARDQMVEVEQEAESLLVEVGDDNAFLSCTILAQLMSARRELYHFHDALNLQAETRRALARPGSTFASIAFKSAVAPGLVGQGKTDVAVEMLEEALQTAETISGVRSGVAALPALMLAEIRYEQDDLARAQALVADHVDVMREFGLVDQMLAAFLVDAKLHVLAGKREQALARLDDAQLIGIEFGLQRLCAALMGEQVRLLLSFGDVAGAWKVFRDCRFEAPDRPPTDRSTRQHEAMAIAWIRLQMRDGRLAAARTLARNWRDYVRRMGAIQSTARFNILLSQIAALAGDTSTARRTIREAVILAAPSRWIRMFLDEGSAVMHLLEEGHGAATHVETPTDAFVRAMLSRTRPIGDAEIDALSQDVGGHLVDREIQILKLVENGLRNREIGDRLGLTEGTVKWYMQQIFDKLGVRRRPQAVIRARHLGFI